MRSINSLSILNPLEERILATVPTSSKHVAVIGDGDGRLARAMKAKLGADARIFVIEHRTELHKYLNDFEDVGEDPWKVEAFDVEVGKHGLFDFAVFYGLHEYWRGQLRKFQQIVASVRPNASVWVTFVNSSALRYLDQALPPLRLAADSLAAPGRFWGRLDYASWMAYGALLNVRVESVWGLFDHASFKFCENPVEGGSADWDIKGAKVQARTAAEIVHWGAAYVGVQMAVRPEQPAGEEKQLLGGAAFTAQLFQVLVDPFPEVASEESELAWAENELRAVRANRDSLRPSQLIEFILGLVEGADSVRDVLVVGAGWGRDVQLLQKARPEWRCVGVECSPAMRALGDAFRAEHGLQVEGFNLGEKFPFADKSFDIVLSFGFMSRLYDQAVAAVVQEMMRVGRKTIYHLEDGRGAEQSVKIKQNSLAAVYAQSGHAANPAPILIQGQDSGFLFYKVAI